tara:strand:- start:1226 stop:2044 length:819 start_codon:yes stop_codon:yes gene_type:complete
MSNIVLTVSLGDRPFKKFTIDSQQKYAKRIGADFKCIEDFKVDPKYNNIQLGRGGNTSYLIKLLVIQEALEKYDRVIWLDDTCVVSSNTPNLLDIVPSELFAAHNEGILEWVMADKQTKDLYEKNNIQNIITSQNYFNSGVMVISKAHKPIFNSETIIDLGEAGHFKNAYPEQTYLNYMISKYRVGFFALPSIFNRMAVNLEEFEGERVNYETFTPMQTRLAELLENFNFLNKVNTKVGKLNGAYIYHITSMYKPKQRFNLIKRLYEIKVSD